MEQEEQDIRGYFGDMQRPIKEDPTLVRRRNYDEKMKTFKSAMADVKFRTVFDSIYNFDGNTPEEQETIIDCKRYMRHRIYEGVAMCTGATSVFSYSNRRFITRTGVLFGVGFGLATGTILGLLRST
jgi:hypothetical protein